MRFSELCKIASLMALIVIFSTACKDDDPVLPEYAGTWVTVRAVPTQNGYSQVKEVMTLSENSYSDLLQSQISTDVWTSIFSMGGTMVVSGNLMNVTLTEIGITSLSGVTGLPTGVITTYKKGTDEFNQLITDKDQPKTFEAKYSISGNKLTIQIDKNGNGDYLDEMETSVYTKQ